MADPLISLFLKPAVPPKAELEKALKHFGFRNPVKVWRELSPFGQATFGRSSFAELLPLLLVEFSRSADPDLAATHFSAFAEASFHSSQLFQYLVKNPMARQVLAKVLGLSPAQAAVLSQDPPLLYWLLEEDGLTAKFSRERLETALERETTAAKDLEGKLNALRRVKRRAMLRLTARDLMGLCDVKDLTFEIATLADALLEHAILLGREKLKVEGVPAPKGDMVVLGMGKLGGQELNYSSDIDLLFVYEAAGDPVEANRYFNELALFVLKTMEAPSSLGNLFRVDMNLRPEGMGDLARPLESYLRHYEERSQPWELQALTKARPCAGDKALGERFLAEVEPFIFRKSFDAVYLKEMREIMGMIKLKMEGKGRSRTQVKLGRGGIREIEFIIQYQELVHGGRDPEVRRRNSLEALEVLGAKGILLKADAQFLSEAYRFLRNVEHRLQQVHGLQTHTLPKDPKDLERIARSLGFPHEEGGAAKPFKARYQEVTARVRAFYEEVFKIKRRLDPSAQVVQESLAGDKEALERSLEGGLFLEPRQAAVNLAALAARLKRTGGAKGELVWTGFAPLLLKELAKLPHPDRALNQLESFLKTVALPDLYLRYLLEKPALLKVLLELFSNSLFLSEILVRRPGNFDIAVRSVGKASAQSVQETLMGLEERMAETPDWEDRLDLLRDVKNGEVLRVGLQDLLGKRDLFESFAELSRLAISLSRSALGVATDKMGLPKVGERPSIPKGFCVMAMGKLGAREMNYGSDLDLVFSYSDEMGKDVGFEAYMDLAATFTRALDQPTTLGVAYPVDARLRPMGRQSQMVISVEGFRNYFATHAQAAERLAYTRAVFLAGDRSAGFQLKEVIEDFVYGRGLSRKEFDSILEIRGLMEDKAKKAQGLELKVSPGGIVDVEFFVQILQVAYGKDKPLIRMPHVPTVMGYFKEEGLVPAEVLDELLSAYRFYRLLEARHRMVRETADNELPTDPERLRRLSWRMGLGKGKVDAEKMVEKVEGTQKRVRELFKRLPEWVKFEG